MELNDGLIAAHRGNAIAFLGAGFSIGVKSSNGLNIPTTQQLAARICEEINEDGLAFDTAATVFIEKNKQDPYALATFLEKQFTVDRVDEVHLEFSKIGWRRVYTTNYDNVVEVSSKVSGVNRVSYSTVDNPDDLDPSLPWIVHLHGSPRELIKSGRQSQLILDKNSYLRLEVMKTAWPTRLQADMARADVVFVIGFSFDDLHIARLFRESKGLKRKTFVIIKNDASEGLIQAAKEYGNVFPIGINGFIEEIKKIEFGKLPIFTNTTILNFTEFKLPEGTIEFDSKHIFSLLVYGDFNSAAHLYSMINENIPYSLKRNYAMSQLANSSTGPRRFLVTSRIGNGKSIFLQQMAVQFSHDGYRVLIGGHATNSLNDEIDFFRQDRKPLLFIYESVRGFEEEIKKVSSHLQLRDVILAASRRSAFAGDFQNLKNMVGDGFSRIDLDVLSESDISGVVSLLDYHGVWGDSQGTSIDRRRRFIKNECGAELRALLLHLFRDSSISDKINEPINKLLCNGMDISRIFTALLLARFADCPIDFHDICDIMDIDAKDVHKAFREAGVDDLFNDSDKNFHAKSSVLAEHLLSENLSGNVVFSAVEVMIERLVDFRRADSRYEESIPRILRFANVTRLFRRSDRRHFIGVLYERVLRIEYIREDPQFWLQLSMARMEKEDWLEAEKALQSAYGKARARPAYRTYMLDNQMARFLLTSSVAGYSKNIEECAIRAKTLMGSRFMERSGDIDIYAYRLMEPMISFRDKFKLDLSKESINSINEIIRRGKEILLKTQSMRSLDSEEDHILRLLKKATK